MTDDMLRAVRDNGGAVCVNFGPEFLDADWAQKLDAAEKTADFGAIAPGARIRPEGRGARRAAKAAGARGASLPAVPA